ncbi:hypothetical protein [Pseudarthrobacter sp. H2]|uniref:hypothetical protein n=1 Tax=Pseudarthrobacter sp. H2 TaxID=3418415 RepID=UPI003CF52803
MTGTALSRGIRIAAALGVAAAALTGCSGDGKGTPAWTSGSGPAGTTTPDASSSGGSPGASAGASTGASPGATAEATASGGGSAAPGSTASAWKVFTDPAKSVSFELPQEWLAQSVAPDSGTMPGALKIEVKDAKGGYLATLQTGLQPQPVPACADGAARPYVVVSSVPVELPHGGGAGTIDPHVVFRVIQGYKYFGSYGITNILGGSGGTSCALQNLVRGPEGRGDYSFGDLAVLKTFAPDQKVAPAKAFDTLDQAAKYVNESSEFANVQRMLMSLKIRN